MQRVGWLAYLANKEAGLSSSLWVRPTLVQARNCSCCHILHELVNLPVIFASNILFSRQMSTSQAPVDQSIARAFINFLEEESSVRSPPTLPVVEMARAKTDQVCNKSIISTPLGLSEHHRQQEIICMNQFWTF